MRSRVGDRLPKFTADEAALVKGALDFVGINHYTTYYTKHNSTNLVGRLLHNTLADTGTISLRELPYSSPDLVHLYLTCMKPRNSLLTVSAILQHSGTGKPLVTG
jgi:hypothetical protein